MTNKIFLAVIDLITTSPKTRKFFWKSWYQILAKTQRDSRWKFMNYGFVDEAVERIFLYADDEKDRASIQLYHHVATRVPLEGKNVLEVGSGRGGGASYMARYLKPRNVMGIDISHETVVLARTFNNLPNLQFRIGDSEHLPFPDNHFDVVINIESSHCYGSFAAFIKEVERVLTPGGYFSWADMDSADLKRFNSEIFASCGMTIIEENDITRHILAGLDSTSDEKEQAIDHHIPRFIRNIFKTFATIKGTGIYNKFKNGSMVYLNKVLQKA
jgi:ubiquinone/menaquinone biosynthesis C-methylase UbiE